MEKLPFELIERKVLVKKESESKFGQDPNKRDTKDLIKNGVICINKPDGPSSHQVVDYVKRILGLSKAGHGGTLDPHVTGVLPIALEKVTKVAQALLNAGKEYVALMHVHKDVREDKIRELFSKYVGEIEQLPPKRSAVKRKLRKKKIYYLTILEVDGQDVLFKIGCQGGTYIRKFIHDFGQDLGVGAHMQQLVRTKAGPFSDKEMYSLQDLKDAYVNYKEGNDEMLRKIIKPVEFAVSHLGKVWVHDNVVDNICHGASLNAPGVSKVESNIEKWDVIAILSLKGELIALGEAVVNSKEMIKLNKGLVVKIVRVFMERGTYPRL